MKMVNEKHILKISPNKSLEEQTHLVKRGALVLFIQPKVSGSARLLYIININSRHP